MLHAYWYIRVSGRSQVEGDGPERQRLAIQDFCQKHEIVFAGEFFEAAVSGTKEGMDRPKFAEMIETIDAHKEQGLTPIGVIVVERLDRLARDLMVSEMLLKECRERGIKVFAVDQGALIDMATDGDDPTRTLIRQLLGALAQWEKSMLVKKLRSARQRKRSLTGRCEGMKPYGHLPGESHIAKVLVNLRASGLNNTAIAQMLNDQGLRNRSGERWEPEGIRSLFRTKRKEICAEHILNT